MELGNAVQLVVSGLTMGALYTLVAKGLYITHLTTHRVNFGQGDFMMAAAFLAFATRVADWPLWLGIPAVLLGLAAMGLLLERVAIRPLDRRRGGTGVGAYGWILTTAGVALIVQNAFELTFGKSAQYSPPLFSERRDDVVQVIGARFFVEELVVIGVAIAVVVGFWAFMFRSRIGRAIRAVAFDPDASMLLGIHTRAIKVAVFVIASLLAAVAGILIGPLVTIHPHMGLVFTIKALIVAAIGGFSNPLGILVGGFAFGVAEALSNYFDSSFGDLYPLVFALIVIAIRPSGLFGERSADVR
jgi:branched-chain amino acid transport system permease protein